MALIETFSREFRLRFGRESWQIRNYCDQIRSLHPDTVRIQDHGTSGNRKTMVSELDQDYRYIDRWTAWTICQTARLFTHDPEKVVRVVKSFADLYSQLKELGITGYEYYGEHDRTLYTFTPVVYSEIREISKSDSPELEFVKRLPGINALIQSMMKLEWEYGGFKITQVIKSPPWKNIDKWLPPDAPGLLFFGRSGVFKEHNVTREESDDFYNASVGYVGQGPYYQAIGWYSSRDSKETSWVYGIISPQVTS
jgi:hypothetical protein